MDKKSPDHFEGLCAEDHLKQARLKGLIASTEIHGMEMPGYFSAFADAMKDTAILFLILWTLSLSFLTQMQTIVLMLMLGMGWAVWKPARCALLGWGRLERLHRLIEEERWEIEHNREQEREELTEMYRSKGFSGALLQEVIDTLMSDENRLLRIMLEEELGLTLGIHEHPLKNALGALLGTLLASLSIICAFIFFPLYGPPVASAVCTLASAFLFAKLEKNKKTTSIVWHMAVAALIALIVYVAGTLPLFSQR